MKKIRISICSVKIKKTWNFAKKDLFSLNKGSFLKRCIFLLPVFSLMVGCGSDDENPPVGPPPEITAFQNWDDDTPRAKETISSLIDLGDEAERLTGEPPAFFKKSTLMKRDSRDNIQNGYIYPLYFVDRTRDFGLRFWEDGYTVKKNNPDIANREDRKIQVIQDEMSNFLGNAQYTTLFTQLSNFSLIDFRHYSFKAAPPMIAETCFTIAVDGRETALINFCFLGHRYLKTESGDFPDVSWDWDRNGGAYDPVELFQLFTTGIASLETIYDNPESQTLRDFFITQERLSVQMNKANEAFGGIFQYFIDEKRYLNGRE